MVVLVFLLMVGFSCLGFFAYMASAEKCFLQLCAFRAVLLFREERACAYVPNCVYPFDSLYILLEVFYYFNQTDLQHTFFI